MEYDITQTIADLVHAANPDLEQLQAERSARLSQIPCIDLTCGRWVDIGVELLFSLFELEDQDFAARLPELSHLSRKDRRRFLKHMGAHLVACEYSFARTRSARPHRANHATESRIVVKDFDCGSGLRFVEKIVIAY